jgi:bacillithiol system protein YtxJ
MTLFNSIFGNTNDEVQSSKLNWNAFINLQQFDEIRTESEKKLVVIFKHSTRCSISRMALKQFENEFDLEDKVTLYFLDLLNFRSISNAISEEFQVVHQSPQIILIKDGKAIYNASHSDIDAADLKKYCF